MLFIVWHSKSTDYVSSYTKSNENHILKLKYREITQNDANKNDFSYHTLQGHHLWENVYLNIIMAQLDYIENVFQTHGGIKIFWDIVF